MQRKTGKDFVLQTVSGAGIATICTLVGILLFALVLKAATMSSVAVKVVNQFIKVLSVFVGCFFCLRGKGGWIKGLVAGLLYMCIAYLIFSLLGGKGAVEGLFVVDLLFGAVTGAISGVLAVNAKGASAE